MPELAYWCANHWLDAQCCMADGCQNRAEKLYTEVFKDGRVVIPACCHAHAQEIYERESQVLTKE